MTNNSNKRLFENLEGYLTAEAKRLVEVAVETGMDRDLAIACLEQILKDEIFTLED